MIQSNANRFGPYLLPGLESGGLRAGEVAHVLLREAAVLMSEK